MTVVPLARVLGEALCRRPLSFSSCSCGVTALWPLKEELSDFAFALSWSRMAWTMGAIMAVVAVLLIHMERKAVTPMNPSISLPDNEWYCQKCKSPQQHK